MANVTRHSLRHVLTLQRDASFLQKKSSSVDLLALVVLNLDGSLSSLFETLWRNSSVRVCADGGANRLYDNVADQSDYVPDLIHGDLDSMRPEVGEFFSSRGALIRENADQDMHDLDKCLSYLQDVQAQASTGLHVVVLGAFGGQFHHAMANVNMTFRYARVFSSLVLLDSKAAGFLLTPGKHEIERFDKIEDSKACGLIPIGCKTRAVTTKGLRWNLSGSELAFGGMVSSSNEMVADMIEIDTSDNLFWTTSFKNGFQDAKL